MIRQCLQFRWGPQGQRYLQKYAPCLQPIRQTHRHSEFPWPELPLLPCLRPKQPHFQSHSQKQKFHLLPSVKFRNTSWLEWHHQQLGLFQQLWQQRWKLPKQPCQEPYCPHSTPDPRQSICIQQNLSPLPFRRSPNLKECSPSRLDQHRRTHHYILDSRDHHLSPDQHCSFQCEEYQRSPSQRKKDQRQGEGCNSSRQGPSLVGKCSIRKHSSLLRIWGKPQPDYTRNYLLHCQLRIDSSSIFQSTNQKATTHIQILGHTQAFGRKVHRPSYPQGKQSGSQARSGRFLRDKSRSTRVRCLLFHRDMMVEFSRRLFRKNHASRTCSRADGSCLQEKEPG